MENRFGTVVVCSGMCQNLHSLPNPPPALVAEKCDMQKPKTDTASFFASGHAYSKIVVPFLGSNFLRGQAAQVHIMQHPQELTSPSLEVLAREKPGMVYVHLRLAKGILWS